MAEMGLIQSEVVRIQRKIVSKPALFCQQAEDLVKQKFEFPLPNVEDQDDPLMKGEFLVMLELMGELPGAKEGKEKVHCIILEGFYVVHFSMLNPCLGRGISS